MTAQFFTNELTNLIQEAKRKSTEIRGSAEASLADIKALTGKPDTEIVLDLALKPSFPTPFVQSCRTRNVKLTAIGVSCLQRLIVSRGLAKSKLKEVLESFREASNLGQEIQLKILQALPPLLQNYAKELQGDLLREALLICSILQGSKLAVINNTAAATLQQLVITVFDKVVVEDDKLPETAPVVEVPAEDGTVPVRPAALDAYRVFLDVCLLTEGHKPQFIRFNELAQTFCLELIESVLTNHGDVFLSHPEQAHILRTRVIPFVTRSLSDRLNFPTTVRIIRVFYIILRRHIMILQNECEVTLGLLIHMLDPDATAPWKRALCLEILRGCFAEAALIRNIYSLYDAKEGRKNVIRDLSASLARLATEKPSVIGLGTQSSIPSGHSLTKDLSSEQAALEAGGVAGVIGGAVGLGDVTVAGLSTQWSMVRVQCIDQLDKTGPPSIPESYVYCLTLICINSFSEGLAKFILPFVNANDKLKSTRLKKPRPSTSRTRSNGDLVNDRESHSRSESPMKDLSRKRSTHSRKQQLPSNPLKLENHPLKPEITTSAAMVDTCWPALLACYSTFLYATLDNELYHGLVRSLQKFTHVAGVLGLATPRDAFITTLGKAAVPPNIHSAHLASLTSTQEGIFPSSKSLLSVDSLVSPVSGPSDRNYSFSGASFQHDQNHSTLNARNLICLRALLNIGTALGPTLGGSWSIILETLQRADSILYSAMRRSGRSGSVVSSQRPMNDSQSSLSNVTSELSAVEATATRMLQSTKDFPDESFVTMLLSLCELLGISLPTNVLDIKSASNQTDSEPPMSPSRKPVMSRQRRGSMIHVQSAPSTAEIEDQAFVLMKLGEIAQINIQRLIGNDPITNGWDVILKYLTMIIGSREIPSSVRLGAADVLHDLAISAAKAISTESKSEDVAEVQYRILNALRQEIYDLDDPNNTVEGMQKLAELDIHRTSLETLYMILELTGESLVSGWDLLFDIINTSFDSEQRLFSQASNPATQISTRTKSPKLVRASFNSLQLICSDFLSVLPLGCVLVLLDTLFSFSRQHEDLNISLTVSKIPEEEESELLELAREGFLDVDPYMAMWMVLLLRLAGVSKDDRLEVRNGSIQTLFRIFDTYGHQLGPRAWDSCLKIVVFKMMQEDHVAKKEFELNQNRKQWNETITLVLTGIGTLYTNYFEIFSRQGSFEHTWAAFITYLKSLIEWHSVEVNATIFKELTHILEKATTVQLLDNQCQDQAWVLWESHGTDLVDHRDTMIKGSSQEALVAYVETFKPLYRLLEQTATQELMKKGLDRLEQCLLYPDAPAYFSDVDVLTPLQTSIMSCMSMVRTDIPGVPYLLLKAMARISGLPLNDRPLAEDLKSRRPTYISCALSAIKMTEALILNYISSTPDILESGAIRDVLEALSEPINLKYTSKPTSLRSAKKPPLWIEAAQTLLRITNPILLAMNNHKSLDKECESFIWSAFVNATKGLVTEQNNESNKYLSDDEAHDIDAFHKLRALIVPGLGKATVQESTIKVYVESIFNASLLYDVAPETLSINIPLNHTAWKPLQGSTSDLVLIKRSSMSYVCIDELFLLSDSRNSGNEWARIAEIAVPYMIQRTALVLSRYIADQPIRGRMPQPQCQRKEILYILQKLVHLDSPAPRSSLNSSIAAILSTTKSHILTLFSLITKTIAVAQGDEELLNWLCKALQEIQTIF